MKPSESIGNFTYRTRDFNARKEAVAVEPNPKVKTSKKARGYIEKYSRVITFHFSFGLSITSLKILFLRVSIMGSIKTQIQDYPDWKLQFFPLCKIGQFVKVAQG